MKQTINWNDPQDAAFGTFLGKALNSAIADVSPPGCDLTPREAADAFMQIYYRIHAAIQHESKNHPMDRESLQRASKEVEAQLPDGWGYMLFMFELGKATRVTYTANGDRKDCIAALKEWLLRQTPENWLKHID